MKKGKNNNILDLIFTVVYVLSYAGIRLIRKQPWPGILAALWLGTGLLYIFWKRRRQEKRSTGKGNEIPETADADQEDSVLNVPAGQPVPFLLMMQNINSRIYQVFSTPGRLMFVHVGNELAGVDPEKLREDIPDAAAMAASEKNFVLERQQIEKIELKLRRTASTNYPNSGTAAISGDKKRTYVILNELAPDQIRGFFADMGQRVSVDQKSMDRRTKKEERDREVSRWNGERQDPETFKKLKTATTVLMIAGAVCSIAFLFIGNPYILWSTLCLLCFAAVVALGLIFPQYYTLMRDSRKAAGDTGVKSINLLGPLMASGAGMTMRMLLDFNFLPWWSGYAAGGILSVLLIAAFAWRLRELHGRIGLIIASWFLVLICCIGVPAQINSLLDFREPDYQPVTVIDHHISQGSRGPDWYYVTIRTEDGTEMDLKVGKYTYLKARAGYRGTMIVFQGALGIPYAEYESGKIG